MQVNTAAFEYIHKFIYESTGFSEWEFVDKMAASVFDYWTEGVEPEFNLGFEPDLECDFLQMLKRVDDSFDGPPFWGDMDIDYIQFFEIEDGPERAKELVFTMIDPTEPFVLRTFSFHALVAAFLGGIYNNEDYDLYDLTSVTEVYKLWTPAYIAARLSRRYEGRAIKSIPKDAKPLDVSRIPAYLLVDNDNLIEENGLYYLKDDISGR